MSVFYPINWILLSMNKKNIDTYLYGNIYPRWVVLLVDSFIIVLSFVFAFIVHFKDSLIEINQPFVVGLFTVLGVNLVTFYLFKIPSRVLRYSSFPDFIRIFISQTSAFVLLLIIAVVPDTLTNTQWISVGLLPIIYVLGTLLLISLRIIVKVCFEFRYFNERDTIRVMIYAREDKGVDIVRRLRSDSKSRYRIRGFISDDPKMSGRYLMAIPIYINDDKLLGIIDEKGIDALVVDSQKMKMIKSADIIDQLLARRIKLITLSPVEELKKEKQQNKLSSTRDIMIEELIMREPIKIDLTDASCLLRGKRILITGAAGSIGRGMVRRISAFQPDMLILIDQAETPMHDVRLMMEDEFGEITAHTIVADITNKSRIENVFAKYRPQYVFHFAAYKHIPMLEVDISEAIQVNIMGTCNMVDLAVKYRADEFVMASTDKAVKPASVMGVSKRIAEIYIQSLAKALKSEQAYPTKLVIARFGNILDSSGSVLLHFKEQIARKKTLIVTHPDVVRHFMTTSEVVSLILEAGSLQRSEIVYTFDMGNPVRILDLAKRMINLSGYIPGKDIKIEFAGLRPGEKLSKEQVGKEEYLATKYENILIVPDCGDYDYEYIDSAVRKIIAASYQGDVLQIMNDIKNIVPEFVGNECNCDKFTINN